MLSLHVENAKQTNLVDLNKIMRRSKGFWGYSESYLDEFMQRLPVTENCIKNYDMYCVYIDGILGAFYGFKKNDEDQDELDFFFLDAPYIGKGLGRELWKFSLISAKELKIKTFVIASEPHAEKFYLKMGCKKIGVRPPPIVSMPDIPLLIYSIE